MSHWDQAPFVAQCADCAFHVQAINADIADAVMELHGHEQGHHLWAVSEA